MMHSHVTWPMPMWMTRLYVTWLVHMCHDDLPRCTHMHSHAMLHTHAMMHSHAHTCHDAHTWHMTNAYVNDPSVRDMTHSYVPWRPHTWHDAGCHDSFGTWLYVTWLIWAMTPVTWLICGMTHVTWLICCMTYMWQVHSDLVQSSAHSFFSAQVQHTATHCNTLQHTATHCNTLQHTATHCNTLPLTAKHCNTNATHYDIVPGAPVCVRKTETEGERQGCERCNTLQHIATQMQHTATQMQHTST